MTTLSKEELSEAIGFPVSENIMISYVHLHSLSKEEAHNLLFFLGYVEKGNYCPTCGKPLAEHYSVSSIIDCEIIGELNDQVRSYFTEDRLRKDNEELQDKIKELEAKLDDWENPSNRRDVRSP